MHLVVQYVHMSVWTGEGEGENYVCMHVCTDTCICDRNMRCVSERAGRYVDYYAQVRMYIHM